MMGLPTAGPTLSELVHVNGSRATGHDFGALAGYNRDTAMYHKGYQDGYKAKVREKRPLISSQQLFQKGMAYGYSKAKAEHNATLRRVVGHMEKMLAALKGELKRGRVKKGRPRT